MKSFIRKETPLTMMDALDPSVKQANLFTHPPNSIMWKLLL